MKNFFLFEAWFLKWVGSSFFLAIVFPMRIALVLSFFFLVLFYLFRKIKIDRSGLDGNDTSLVFAPVSGCISVREKDKSRLFVRPHLFSGFSVIMPLKAEIIAFTEFSSEVIRFLPFIKKTVITVKLESEELGLVSLRLARTGLFLHPKVWVRGGDRAFVGSVIGNLPFGGSLEIIMNNNVKILVNDKTKVEAAVTLVAAARTDKNG